MNYKNINLLKLNIYKNDLQLKLFNCSGLETTITCLKYRLNVIEITMKKMYKMQKKILKNIVDFQVYMKL